MLPLDRQNEYRERYRALKRGWQPSGEVYEATVRVCLPPDGGRVLDVGCGRGGLPEKLVAEGCAVFGIDADLGSLSEYRAPAVARAAGAGARLPFSSGAFDLVICSWLLEHVTDPAAVLREVGRLLVAGGRFVFLTPNVRHPLLTANRLARWLPALQRRAVPRLYGREAADTFPVQYRANTPKQIRRLARAAGLRVAKLELVADPTYLAFGERMLRIATLLERLLPAGMRIHMVGVLVK